MCKECASVVDVGKCIYHFQLLDTEGMKSNKMVTSDNERVTIVTNSYGVQSGNKRVKRSYGRVKRVTKL